MLLGESQALIFKEISGFWSWSLQIKYCPGRDSVVLCWLHSGKFPLDAFWVPARIFLKSRALHRYGRRGITFSLSFFCDFCSKNLVSNSPLVLKKMAFLARCSFSALHLLLLRVKTPVIRGKKSSFGWLWDVVPMLVSSLNYKWALFKHRPTFPDTYLPTAHKNRLIADLIPQNRTKIFHWELSSLTKRA